MSGGHTPGPWSPAGPYKNFNNVYDLFEIHWSPDGECVAETVHGEANARLIAAAPELLEALSAFVVGADAGHVSVEVDRNARAAITKATGTPDPHPDLSHE
jgi:hypothetical protein